MVGLSGQAGVPSYARESHRPPLAEWRSPDCQATEAMYGNPIAWMSSDAALLSDTFPKAASAAGAKLMSLGCPEVHPARLKRNFRSGKPLESFLSFQVDLAKAANSVPVGMA